MKTWIGCTANWNNVGDDDKWWIVRNDKQEELARLPYSMGEQAVMDVVRTVREFGIDLFEAGKEFGGQAMMAAGREKLRAQYDACVSLEAHNAYLAEKIESLIGAVD